MLFNQLVGIGKKRVPLHPFQNEVKIDNMRRELNAMAPIV